MKLKTTVIHIYVHDHTFVLVTEYDCPKDKGKCRDEIQCISLDNFCDGYEHCKDKSDEDPGFCRGMWFFYIL